MRLLGMGAVFSLLSACYNPQHVVIACPPTSPQCPDGQICVGQICVSNPDLAGSPDDLSGIDPAADLSAGSPVCKAKNGTRLGPKAEACPGPFAKGAASSLCDTGYKPCTAAAGIDLVACAQLSGFYVADVPAYWMVSMQTGEVCNTSVANQLLYGCGSGPSRAGAQLCAGLPRVADIGSNGWVGGGNGTLAETSNSDNAQGVLCCRP